MEVRRESKKERESKLEGEEEKGDGMRLGKEKWEEWKRKCKKTAIVEGEREGGEERGKHGKRKEGKNE